MKFKGKQDYFKLYNKLQNANGKFMLKFPDGTVFKGDSKSPQLAVLLLNANPKGECQLEFEDPKETLYGINYLMYKDLA